MLEITILSTEGKELKRYELDGNRPLSIGRGTLCDIQVPLPDISRQHATLVPDEDGEWILQDMDSTHGCVFKGERVRTLPIQPGMEVRLASAVVRFSDLADRIGAELNAQLEDTDRNAETCMPLAETLPPPGQPPRTPEVVIRSDEQKKKTVFFWKS